jgi:putative PEP-CTERM system histidine kinase
VETTELTAIGYVLQTLSYLVLAAIFLAKRPPFYIVLTVASAASSMAGAVLAIHAMAIVPFSLGVVFVEVTRIVSWLVVAFAILRQLDAGGIIESYVRRFGLPLLVVAFAILLTYCGIKFDSTAVSVVVTCGVCLGLALIILLEQIYRNLPSDSTSSLKYICVALLVVYGYDSLFFARSIAVGLIDDDYWSARGFVSAIAVLPLAMSSMQDVFDPVADSPRQMVFYRFSFAVLGGVSALWLGADYLIDNYSVGWRNIAPILLVVTVAFGAGMLLASASIRARIRVFLTKFFFRYKYNYRKEWLRFISTLSESGLEKVPATAVRAIAQIVNSPGGVVWVQEEDGDAYLPLGSWRCDIPVSSTIGNQSALVRFLVERQWVIDLEEKQRYPARYGGLKLDAELQRRENWWLIVPLFLGKRLFGFVWLIRPRVVRSLNFEDHDLLRTVGRHVAMHINQAESDKRLAESSQFGTYNRLTAFLMHDLNNLIAQQSLVVRNAERFRDNPQFVDDAIDTIANSVSRMTRLMEQLTRGFKTSTRVETDLRDSLLEAIRRTDALSPKPVVKATEHLMHVLADPERLTNVFEHLLRNAQDATADDGQIEVDITKVDTSVCVSISDTGEGMSPEFVRERLFRPFDSTKGSHAMGIGAYQAREYIRMMGGQLQVESIPGQGTTFTLHLPAAQ